MINDRELIWKKFVRENLIGSYYMQFHFEPVTGLPEDEKPSGLELSAMDL